MVDSILEIAFIPNWFSARLIFLLYLVFIPNNPNLANIMHENAFFRRILLKNNFALTRGKKQN